MANYMVVFDIILFQAMICVKKMRFWKMDKGTYITKLILTSFLIFVLIKHKRHKQGF